MGHSWNSLLLFTMKSYFKRALTKLYPSHKNISASVILHPREVTMAVHFLPCYYHAAGLCGSEQGHRSQRQLEENKESSLALPARILPLLLMV